MRIKNEHLRKIFFRIIIPTLNVSLLFILGCAGGSGLRLEIQSGDESAKKIQELADSQMENTLPAENLPDMTGDEYETLGDALLIKKKLFLAYIQYEKSLKLNPDNSRVKYKKGLTLLYGKKNNDAINQFLSVLEDRPDFALCYESIGRAYFQENEYNMAKTYFLKALNIDPKLWRSHIFLGLIYDHNKNFNFAVDEYKAAIEAQPQKGLIYNNLGVSYLLYGKYKMAVSAFNKAIENEHRNPKVYNNLALSLANLGRYDEALDAFMIAGGEAKAYNNLGCIVLSKGNLKKAEKYFQKAIELNPSFYAKASGNLKKTSSGAANFE